MIFSQKKKKTTKKTSLFSSEKNTNQVQRYSIKIFLTQITNSTKFCFCTDHKFNQKFLSKREQLKSNFPLS